MSPQDFVAGTEIVGLDTELILKTLAEHAVDYVLVGGLAALAHGSTLATADADIVPHSSLENVNRLLAALRALSAKVLISEQRLAVEAGEPWEVLELRRGAVALSDADAWHFTTAAGPVDVVMRVTGVGPYEMHIEGAETRDVFGVAVRIAGLDDLIASKLVMGRPKDEVMLRELHELRGSTDSTSEERRGDTR